MSHSRLILAIIKIAFLSVIGVLIATNPGSKKYEQYAAKALNYYLKDTVCQEVTEVLENPCSILVDLARPQLTAAIAQTTRRKNFLVFSIYQTDLSILSALPNYQFETIGILDYFYTYQADKLD
ncbi:MAG TPA: DUF4359 domain-containing protein [Xenococcaceae cyanobacterium]